MTVSSEQSVGAAYGCCEGGFWAVVEALISTLCIVAVHTVSDLTAAPSRAVPELPR